MARVGRRHPLAGIIIFLPVLFLVIAALLINVWAIVEQQRVAEQISQLTNVISSARASDNIQNYSGSDASPKILQLLERDATLKHTVHRIENTDVLINPWGNPVYVSGDGKIDVRFNTVMPSAACAKIGEFFVAESWLGLRQLRVMNDGVNPPQAISVQPVVNSQQVQRACGLAKVVRTEMTFRMPL